LSEEWRHVSIYHLAGCIFIRLTNCMDCLPDFDYADDRRSGMYVLDREAIKVAFESSQEEVGYSFAVRSHTRFIDLVRETTSNAICSRIRMPRNKTLHRHKTRLKGTEDMDATKRYKYEYTIALSRERSVTAIWLGYLSELEAGGCRFRCSSSLP
jgi:hypothetical protein